MHCFYFLQIIMYNQHGFLHFPSEAFSSLGAKSEKPDSGAFSEVKRFGDPNQGVIGLAHSEGWSG